LFESGVGKLAWLSPEAALQKCLPRDLTITFPKMAVDSSSTVKRFVPGS